MRRRISLILAAVVLTPLGLASTAAADNHDVQFAYSASAGGTEVRLLGGAVRSDLTAASGLSGAS